MYQAFRALSAPMVARGALAAAFLTLSIAWAAPSSAGNASAFLTGTVTSNGAPVAHALVTASENNLTAKASTDVGGRFTFPPLALGTYEVSVTQGDLRGDVRVDLGSGGADVVVGLQPLRALGHVVVTGSPPIHGSGSDVVLNSTTLTRLPVNNSFTEMQIQLPGAVRGANGVVHMNGDHGVINYLIDGVPLPQELNRDIGGEINLSDLSFVDLIEGAYPAQYGLRFGSVFNIATRAGTGPAGFDGNFSYGSYNTVNSTIGYHAPIGARGGYDVALSGSQTSRGLDPPDFDSPHNEASSANQFARLALPGGPNDFTNVTFVHSHSTFQIPNDTQFGEPASTDDNETQDDVFLSVQRQHTIGSSGSITFGPAFKASRIQDFGDPENDFAYGEALNVTPPPFGNGGTATDCADAASNPGTFLPRSAE